MVDTWEKGAQQGPSPELGQGRLPLDEAFKRGGGGGSTQRENQQAGHTGGSCTAGRRGLQA